MNFWNGMRTKYIWNGMRTKYIWNGMRTRVSVHVCFLPESYLLRIVKESRSHVLLRDWQPVHETGEEVRAEGSI